MFSRLRSLQIPIISEGKSDCFGIQKLHILRISLLESHFDDFSVFLQNTQILIDSKATKSQNSDEFCMK